MWPRFAVLKESTWHNEAPVVETGYFAGLVDAAIDAGFLFERDVYPNRLRVMSGIPTAFQACATDLFSASLCLF